jgi:hypothetical protein
MSWFIESWCPLDGCAFAVHRNFDIDAATGATIWLPADTVIVLAPPSFSPTPIASEASALWATRGPFQHKFLRQDGSEVAFKSLEQLVELVRRVYVAGGVRGNPPNRDLPPAPEPPPGPNDPYWPPICAALPSAAGTPAGPAAAEAILSRLTAADLSRFAEACFGGAIDECSRGGATRSVDLRDWWAVLFETSSWSGLVPAAFPYGPPNPLPFHLGPAIGWNTDIERSIMDGLLCRIPSAYRIPGYEGLRYLGDHLCVATSDRRYWTLLPSPEHALPIVLASAIVTAKGDDRLQGWMSGTDAWSSRRSRAAKWLSDAVPGPALDSISEAADAIDAVIHHRMHPPPIATAMP